MGLLDLFRSSKNIVVKTNFLFGESHIIIDQNWMHDINVNNVIANIIVYIIRYYNICDDRQKFAMFLYLIDIHNEKVQFELDKDGNYSHKIVWEIIIETLNSGEKSAIDGAFKYGTKAPILFAPELDKAFVNRYSLKTYSKYSFTLKLVKGVIFEHLSIGLYDKMFLPLSVSVLLNQAFVLLTQSKTGKQDLLEALGILCSRLNDNNFSSVGMSEKMDILGEIFFAIEK